MYLINYIILKRKMIVLYFEIVFLFDSKNEFIFLSYY